MSKLDTSGVNATAPEESTAPVVTQETTATAPPAEETKTTEVDPILEALTSDDDEVTTPPEEKKETEAPKEEEEAPAEEAEAQEETTEDKDDARKGENARIRQLVAEKNALRDELARVNSEVYETATKEELIEEGMSPGEASAEALRQELVMRDYNDRVADAQFTIAKEAQDIMNDFPVFNERSDQYDEELATEAAELLQENLVIDENSGQIIGSNVSPYKLYKTLAKASNISSTKGKIEGQKSTSQQLANADTVSSAAPQAEKKDPILEILTSDD